MRNQKGQTMVEYMLLLVVSISLVMTFINSNFFKRFFGTEGKLAKAIKDSYEFGYRHAFITNHPPNIDRENRDGKNHPSYYQDGGANTRFFGPSEPYPKP